jgi:hypothetical protein
MDHKFENPVAGHERRLPRGHPVVIRSKPCTEMDVNQKSKAWNATLSQRKHGNSWSTTVDVRVSPTFAHILHLKDARSQTDRVKSDDVVLKPAQT